MKITIDKPQAIQELGSRSNQEDAIFPEKGKATAKDRVFVLCDGMGGHEHGEVASATVSRTMVEYLNHHMPEDGFVSDDLLRAALAAAYEELDAKDTGELRKMGTTFTLICLHRGGVTMAYIGDSRIYHVRPSGDGGEILFKSRDHSLVYDLFLSGEISLEEMDSHASKNVITRAVLPGEENRTRMDIVHTTDVRDGDVFFLCSDGVLEQMSDGDLLALLNANDTDEDKCGHIVKLTKDNRDNHTALILRVAHVEAEAEDENFPNDEATTKSNAMVFEGQPEVMEPAKVIKDNPERKTPLWQKMMRYLGLFIILAFLAFCVLSI